MKRIEDYRKSAKEAKRLMKMADELRAKADQIEEGIDFDIPAVFVEPSSRNSNANIYISTGHIIGSGAKEFSLSSYDEFVLLEIDKDAMSELRAALSDKKDMQPGDKRIIDGLRKLASLFDERDTIGNEEDPLEDYEYGELFWLFNKAALLIEEGWES